MNLVELKKATRARLRRVENAIGGDAVEKLLDEILEPYAQRDSTMHDGTGLVDQVDEETGEHRSIPIQFHPPRPVAPFVFGPESVVWLEREVKMRARL